MRFSIALLVCWAAVQGRGAAEEPPVRLCEPWEAEYAGDNATGTQVVALWQFTAGAEAADSSGHGHELAFRGAKPVAGGRFGGGLESACGWPVADQGHQAMAKNDPRLSPKGAFTLEMWLQPKPELNQEYPESFLLDKKYVAHADYQVILGAADRGGARALRACLGFGNDSTTWYSEPLKYEPGKWYHAAFTYDGQGGGRFFVNGLPAGGATVSGRQSIAPGGHALSIGDRIGSHYHGFPGVIDQVRISSGALEFRRTRFELVSDRACFVRMESPAVVRFAATNLQRAPLTEAVVTVSLAGMAGKETKISDLGPGKTAAIDFAIDTTLRPDEYRLTAVLDARRPQPYQSRETFPVRIVPRQPPDRFPVVMWGVHGGVIEELPRLKRIGFTHALGPGADYSMIFEAGKPGAAGRPEAVAQTRRMLDEALANDMAVAASLSPASAMVGRQEFRRVDRQGQVQKREDVCGLSPELERFCYNVGASVAQSYGQFPALQAAMIHTEVRDHAGPCFHKHDFEAFRKAAGLDIPPEIGGPHGVNHARLPNFPADRVIPDDHPIYVYYRWYWKAGDGWNGLNTAVVRGLKSTGRTDLWTWHDPAVRVARVYGSGGEVDYLSQWTYSYPDPIRIGLATDELLATAAPLAPKQQVMKMTQIIWYRGQTAPEPKKPEDALGYQAAWEREQPDAPFITIAPMHLREAFWTKIARPIQGIMYHGYQSLVPCQPPTGYRCTNVQTQHELARLIREVVQPLGPMLRRVPGARSDVAMLESFASEMFAGRGTYGWGGSWIGDCWHVLQWAHLQPEIVLDETIAERGLEGYRVLVMPDCDVLTRRVAERVKAFQAAGGLVVGDERLCPAIKPDIVLPVVKRTGKAKEDKESLQAVAAKLRKELDGRYARAVDASAPDVIAYRRRYKDADYVFVVNDRREYGDYVGQHGLVMENGLPSDAVLSVRRGGVVYDLLAHRPVPARTQDGSLAMDVHLGPCDGRVYLIVPRAIETVRVQSPQDTKRGSAAVCAVEVLDAGGKPIEAVLPLEITIRDPEGRLAELSGSYAAIDGRVSLKLDIAPNDPPGVWTIEARDLASGRGAVGYLRVAGQQPWPPVRKPVPKSAAEAVQPKG
jgi:hypothetical protein